MVPLVHATGCTVAPFEPKDAGYATRVRSNFDCQQEMHTPGIEIAALDPNEMEL